jgi:hypothetical protein
MNVINDEAYTQPAGSPLEILQERLHPHHLEMLLEESAISSAVVAERGCYTATVKAERLDSPAPAQQIAMRASRGPRALLRPRPRGPGLRPAAPKRILPGRPPFLPRTELRLPRRLLRRKLPPTALRAIGPGGRGHAARAGALPVPRGVPPHRRPSLPTAKRGVAAVSLLET